MQPIYVETSDEITTVIERIKAADDLGIALVVPKGAILLQSIVNLKLAKKAALDDGKEMVLITTDRIGRNLSTQVGIPVYTRLDAKNMPENGDGEETDDIEPRIVAGVKVHRYYDKEENPEEKIEDLTKDTPEPSIEPIIPKEILQPATPEAEAEIPEEERPITIRSLDIQVPEKTAKEEGSETIVVPVVEEKETPASGAEKIDNKDTQMPAAKTPEKSKGKPRNWRRPFIFAAYVLLLAVLTAAGLGAFYFPRTTVTLHVASEAWEKELVTTAKASFKSVSADNQTIPAELISVESTEKLDYTATGTKDTGDKATGTALIFNGYSSNQQVLPEGAKISANGHDFYTTAAATVPGARVENGKPVSGSVSVGVIADQAGPDSNLTAITGTIISPASNLYAQITSTTGGTSRQIQVVTQTDIANAKAALTKKAHDNALAKLVEQIKSKDLLFDDKTDSFTLEGYAFSVPAGTEASTVQVSGKGVIKRLVVDNSILKTATQSRALANLPENTTARLENTSTTKLEVNLTDQIASITTLSQGRQSAVVPVEEIRNSLVRRGHQEGLDLLNIVVKNARIEVEQTPAWWPVKNFPYSPLYLKVGVVYE